MRAIVRRIAILPLLMISSTSFPSFVTRSHELSLSLSLPFIQTVQLRFDVVNWKRITLGPSSRNCFQFHPVYFRGKQRSRCSRTSYHRGQV